MPEPAPTSFSPVALAPTFNNAATLIPILQRIESTGLPILVVNDGSTDETARLLAEWTKPSRRVAVTVITHPKNLGKAEALVTGFEAAARAGYTHVATIDTDGQLDPESLPALIDVASRSPRALVLGVRSESIDGYPGRSLVGRRLSNLALCCEAGVRVEDSQCGLRVYPLALLAATRCKSGRYAFEAEILTRAAWAGFPIEQVEVPCRYFPKDERVSHFKPGRDSLSGLALHARLLTEAVLLPWRTRPPRARRHGRRTRVRHPRRRGRRSGIVFLPTIAQPSAPVPSKSGPPGLRCHTPPAHQHHARREWLHRFGAWVSPLELWRQIRTDRIGRAQIAVGLSIGAFIANLPIYGFQMLLALYTARRLHLHPLSVVLGSRLSTPPINTLLFAGAVVTGHFLLHGVWITPADLNPGVFGWWSVVGTTLLDWTLGGIVLGAAIGMLVFAVATVALKFIPFREDEHHPHAA